MRIISSILLLLVFQDMSNYKTEQTGNPQAVDVQVHSAKHGAKGPALQTQNTGTIEGAVVDQHGFMGPGADIAIFNVSDMRPLPLKVVADAKGQFTLRNIPAGTYLLCPRKEDAGLGDSLFSFFGEEERQPWARVTVQNGQTVRNVVLNLGPKHAVLKLLVEDQDGVPTGAVLHFQRRDNPRRRLRTSHDVSQLHFVPPNREFQFNVMKEGYETWSSDPIRLKSGESLSMRVQLKRPDDERAEDIAYEHELWKRIQGKYWDPEHDPSRWPKFVKAQTTKSDPRRQDLWEVSAVYTIKDVDSCRRLAAEAVSTYGGALGDMQVTTGEPMCYFFVHASSISAELMSQDKRIRRVREVDDNWPPGSRSFQSLLRLQPGVRK